MCIQNESKTYTCNHACTNKLIVCTGSSESKRYPCMYMYYNLKTLRVNCYLNSKNIYMYMYHLTLLSVLIIIRVFSHLNFKYYQAKQAFGGQEILNFNKIEYLFI